MNKYGILLVVILMSGCYDAKPNKPIAIIKSCSVDTPADKSKFSQNANFAIGGWFYDAIAATPNSKIKIQFLSENRTLTTIVDTDINVRRLDVEAVFKNPNAQLTGFQKEIKQTTLKPGVYTVTLMQEYDQAVVTCGNMIITIEEQ